MTHQVDDADVTGSGEMRHEPDVTSAGYDLPTAIPLLERTPGVLCALLAGLPEPWTHATEGPGTWSPFDVVGHLIHGERSDWIPRVEHLLTHGTAVPFPPFDREAMFAASQGLTLETLLEQFADERRRSIARLHALGLGDDDFARRGLHPAFGEVTLGQLLATWVVHDLTHLAQIARTMALRYDTTVGPWRAYLSVLRR